MASSNSAFINSKNHYYSLNLGTIEIKHSKQSFYRKWNRLTSLQKTIVAVFFIIFGFYILTHVEFHHNSKNNISNKHEHEVLKKDKIEKLTPKLLEKVIKNNRSKNEVLFKGPTNFKQKSVVNTFLHAWNGYKKYAWGYDELLPISKVPTTWFNLGLTIVDSLDTMLIMNLEEEFNLAKKWVSTELNLDSDRYNNLFEITIRILGGLLSAYHLSSEKIFLEKAYDLGNRTLSAFNTRSSIPYSDINLMRRSAKPPTWTSDSSISEVSTIQLEFKDLSIQTNDNRFNQVVSKISEHIHDLNKPNGLVPIYINTQNGQFVGHTITLGARGDSYYEYLLKQWIQMGAKFDKSDPNYYLLEDWLYAVKGVQEKLVRQTKPNNLTFVGELISDSFSPKMDHLVCFLPGNLILGWTYLIKNKNFSDKETRSIFKLAEELTETCYQTYVHMDTGLSPEITYFNIYEGSKKDLYVKEADRHNLLRPETIESLYYMYKITKNKKYQDYGWNIFQSFEKYTKIETGGYSSINDVTNKNNVRPRDKMESFFLAETLKYFYLLFEDDSFENIDLNKWVINTEAHPLPIYH